MDLKKRYPADATKTKDGVRVDMGGAIFILSFYQSSQAQLVFQAEIQKLKAEMTPENAVVQGMRNTLVNVIVLGWENLQEDGKLIEYSKENCERILDDYIGLDVELMEKSSDISLFRAEQVEEMQGN